MIPLATLGELAGLMLTVVVGVTVVGGYVGESRLSIEHYAVGAGVVLVLYGVLQVALTGHVNWHQDQFHAATSISHLAGVFWDLLPGGHLADVWFGQPWNIGPSWADEAAGVAFVCVFLAGLFAFWRWSE